MRVYGTLHAEEEGWLEKKERLMEEKKIRAENFLVGEPPTGKEVWPNCGLAREDMGIPLKASCVSEIRQSGIANLSLSVPSSPDW